MISSKLFKVLLLIIAVNLSFVLTLECYDCNSENDPHCLDKLAGDDQAMRKIICPGAPHHYDTHNKSAGLDDDFHDDDKGPQHAPACIKVSYTGHGKHQVYRNCGIVKDCKSSEEDFKRNNFTNIKCSECTRNLCNHAARGLSTLIPLILAAPVIVLLRSVIDA